MLMLLVLLTLDFVANIKEGNASGNLDDQRDMVRVQYKIDKGSIVVPVAPPSGTRCRGKAKDCARQDRFKPVRALQYKVAVVNVFVDVDLLKNRRRFHGNEEIRNALMRHMLNSMDLVGAVRLQCYDKLYESYIEELAHEKVVLLNQPKGNNIDDIESLDYDAMLNKLSETIIPTKVGINSKSKQVQPYAKFLRPFYNMLVKSENDEKFYLYSDGGKSKTNDNHGSTMVRIFQSLVILSYTNSAGEIVRVMKEKDLRKCKLNILSRTEQTLKPPKDLKVYGTSLIGSYPLQSVTRIMKKNKNTCHNDDINKNTKISNFQETYSRVLLYLSGMQTNVSTSQDFQETYSRALSYLSDMQTKMQANVSTPLDVKMTRFLSISEHDAGSESEESEGGDETPPDDPEDGWEALQGLLDQILGIVDPTFQEIIMPFKDAFMSWLASRADEELQATMPNEAASTVEDSVTREMEPAMDISITMNIGPSLAEILPDMINDIVADKTGYDAAHKIAEAAVPPLSDMLSLSAVSAIATRATEEVGMKIARITSHQLALTLGKSIPNAAIPAIVHTITHSPLQDYFCYYCYTHKTYCQYCNYAPSQLYYAQYYANFYSNYYPLYYADYFGAQSGTKRKK